MPPSSPWKGNCRLNLGLGAGALGDQPVMLDAAVLLEVEDRAFDVLAELEVECRGDHLVVFAKRAGGDLAGRRDHRRAANEAEPVLLASLCGGEHPGPVLVGVGLHRDEMMKHAKVQGLGMVDVLGGGFEAE